MKFAVVRQISAGGKTHRDVRLVLDNVPEGTRADAVMTALEAAGRTGTSAPPGKVGEFSAAGIAWGNHVVKSATALPAGTQGLDVAPVESWDDLVAKPGVRRVTLRLAPEVYDRVSMAAARAGRPIQGWFEAAISAALDAQEQPEPAPAPRRKRTPAKKA